MTLIGGYCLQQFDSRRNRDLLTHHPEIQGKILVHLVAHAQFQIVPHGFLESRCRDRQPVRSDRQHRECVDPGLIRSGTKDIVGGDILRLNRHSRHNRALGVLDDPRDSSPKLLGEKRQASRQGTNTEQAT